MEVSVIPPHFTLPPWARAAKSAGEELGSLCSGGRRACRGSSFGLCAATGSSDCSTSLPMQGRTEEPQPHQQPLMAQRPSWHTEPPGRSQAACAAQGWGQPCLPVCSARPEMLQGLCSSSSGDALSWLFQPPCVLGPACGRLQLSFASSSLTAPICFCLGLFQVQLVDGSGSFWRVCTQPPHFQFISAPAPGHFCLFK